MGRRGEERCSVVRDDEDGKGRWGWWGSDESERAVREGKEANKNESDVAVAVSHCGKGTESERRCG